MGGGGEGRGGRDHCPQNNLSVFVSMDSPIFFKLQISDYIPILGEEFTGRDKDRYASTSNTHNIAQLLFLVNEFQNMKPLQSYWFFYCVHNTTVYLPAI